MLRGGFCSGYLLQGWKFISTSSCSHSNVKKGDSGQCSHTDNTGCSTRNRTRLAGGPLLRVATIRRTTDTFLFICHTTNIPLFKFRCNIFIGVRIIKEMPGSVASGTHCMTLCEFLYILLYRK
jgi:hypothetical protein